MNEAQQTNQPEDPLSFVPLGWWWKEFQPMTDADESALGEARHKTISGRGIVGRLIDKANRRQTS